MTDRDNHPERQLATTFVTDRAEAYEDTNALPVIRWLFPDVGRPCTRLSGRVRFGRSPECEVILTGDSVSRVHAEVFREGPAIVLRDLGSANGTYADGQRVSHTQLQDGQILRIGPWIGQVNHLGEQTLNEPLDLHELAPGLWGGPRLRQALDPIRRVAPTDLPIIAVGPTGTGKERVARAIHDWSGRTGQYCAVNCAAIPAQLAEGELFGYRKGAFTGAERTTRGYFRAAHGGTLLLDEIQELPQELQPKLLRVIQERAVVPLGEDRPVPVDARVVVTCQQPLRQLVETEKFRLDLYMRLAGLEVDIPALRERISDVPQLFAFFLKTFATGEPPEVHADLIERLCLYAWPGNVRELELVARRLCAMYEGESVLRAQHLPTELKVDARPYGPNATDSSSNRREHDLVRLAKELRENGGNIARASAQLGISRQRIYRLLDGRSVQEFLSKSDG